MDPGAGLLPAEQESAYRATAQTGDLAESFDELSGTAWRGVSTSAEHSLGESGELVTRQTLLREPPK
ncbi:MAG: hypothetical protein GY862_20355 [Gammaproteobacteria bacterium]|nr:hypothetical protein [Gammaproteobacteria bacterium]